MSWAEPSQTRYVIRKTISRLLIFFNDYYSLFIPISILAKLYLSKKCPKFGIQLPNTGYDNHICHILTVILNRIQWLQIQKYIIDSITLFYRSVSISIALQGCAMYHDNGYRPYLRPNFIESYLNRVKVYAMSTSTSTPTPFELLLTSRFLRVPLTHKESIQKRIIYLTRVLPLASPFLC